MKDDTARIYYGVPLPDGDVDDHLKDLLCHDAPLVLHEKRAHGLPIEQVVRAEVFGQRDGRPVEVAVLELEEPGVIPELVVPDLVPHAAASGYDPLAHLGEQEFEIQPGVASSVPREGLPPFSEEITFAKSVEAATASRWCRSVQHATLGPLARAAPDRGLPGLTRSRRHGEHPHRPEGGLNGAGRRP